MFNSNGNVNGKNKIMNSIPMRYICKLIGEKDHDYSIIEDDKIVKIQNLKLEENGTKILKTEWNFELDRVYEENITVEEVFENEIICSDYFSDMYENFKGTLTFLSNSTDSFSKLNSDLNSFLKNSMGEIFRENSFCRSRETVNKVGMITVSYIDISENKYKDNFLFDDLTIKKEQFSNLKLIEYSDEIIIDGVKEIEISTSEQMEYLLNLVNKKKNSKNKLFRNSFGKKDKEKEKENVANELITLKIYDSSKQNLLSKINFLLFKAYTLKSENNLESNLPNYTVHTKENFNFFNSIQNSNYRSCKLTRIIKDTLEFGNNLTFIITPINLKYIVLLHDILNYIKIRKTNVKCEDLKSCIDPNFLEKFNSLSFCSNSVSRIENYDDKENISFFANSPLPKNKSMYSQEESDIKSKKKTILNFDRLKKIKERDNVILFLSKMNEKINNK